MKTETNCKNCGAPLKYHKCEYCGTNYHNTQNWMAPSNETVYYPSGMTYANDYTSYIAEELSKCMEYSKFLK